MLDRHSLLSPLIHPSGKRFIASKSFPQADIEQFTKQLGWCELEQWTEKHKVCLQLLSTTLLLVTSLLLHRPKVHAR